MMQYKHNTGTDVLVMNIRSLENARRRLQISFKKCLSIPKEFSIDDDEVLEMIEVFTARFARASDILTQKVGVSIIIITREDAHTFIDRMRVLEQLGVIASADTLISIRDARNAIAHEYVEEDVQDVYATCMRLAPRLFEMIETASTYAKTLIPTE